MPKKSRWFIAGLTGFLLIGACVAHRSDGLAKDDPQKMKSDNLVVLTCLRSEDEEMVEVHFSDVVFVTKELSFMHEDGSKTVVRAKDGKVALQNGSSKMIGKRIESIHPGGVFSRRGLSELVPKLIPGLIGLEKSSNEPSTPGNR